MAILSIALVSFMAGRCSGNRVAPHPTYGTDAPPDTNPVFREAYARLTGLNIIESDAVGIEGRPGEFYLLFAPTYRHGQTEDFWTMSANTNPVVRAMGLLCLKYREPRMAQGVLRKSLDDHEDVQVMEGCNSFSEPYRVVAVDIVASDDPYGTASEAAGIDRVINALPGMSRGLVAPEP